MGQRVLVAHPLLADLTVHQARGRGEVVIGPGVFVAVRHLMDGARDSGDQRLAILGHGQAVVMAAEDARQRRETLHQRQQTVAVFAGDRVHLRIAQRQRRVVHKERCRFVAALEQLGLSQPMVSSVSHPFDVPA